MTKYKHDKNIKFTITRIVFFQVQNSLKPDFGPRWGSLPRSPRPLSRMGRGIINYYLARERKYQGTKVPGSESSWNFRSRERKFQGAKVPGSESSWNFRFRERKFLGAKVPVTEQPHCHRKRRNGRVALYRLLIGLITAVRKMMASTSSSKIPDT